MAIRFPGAVQNAVFATFSFLPNEAQIMEGGFQYARKPAASFISLNSESLIQSGWIGISSIFTIGNLFQLQSALSWSIIPFI